jgi:hypothetical protein
MITNTQERRSTFQKNTAKWHYVRRTITNLAVTTQPLKHTSEFLLIIIGQNCVLKHTKTCLRCQRRKKSTDKLPPLHPLPNPEWPNIRIHADLFGEMLAAGRQHKYILCITDAFTKYAIVTAVENKEAETVAKAIFNEWFCKFGIPAQIHTDGGKEFVNKLSN